MAVVGKHQQLEVYLDKTIIPHRETRDLCLVEPLSSLPHPEASLAKAMLAGSSSRPLEASLETIRTNSISKLVSKILVSFINL